MQALVEGSLPPGGRLDFHLDRCLTCRACERVCPSQVRYGQLIDASRAFGAPRRRPGRLTRWLLDELIPKRRSLVRVARLLRLYQRSGLRRLVQGSGLLRLTGARRLDTLMPDIPPVARWQSCYAPAGRPHGHVALFTGCVGQVLERGALEAAITLLNACGYVVHIPQEQTCCGALHLHSGDPARAGELARQNLDAFNVLSANDPANALGKETGLDAVLFTASGCGASLVEYGIWPEVDGIAPPGRFKAPVLDVCSFLIQSGRLAGLSFMPLDASVAVHDPCSLQNVIRAAAAPYRLLDNIPGITVKPLPGNGQCCGAAGSYLLTQPAMADALLADKLALMRSSDMEDVEIVLSTNIGCALQLTAGLRRDHDRIEIMHPVTLLARQLGSGFRSSSPSSS